MTVFSDPKIIEILNSDFIPVAEGDQFLRWPLGSGERKSFWESVREDAMLTHDHDGYQGHFMIAPNGKVLNYSFSQRDPRRLEMLLRSALKSFEGMGSERRQSSNTAPAKVFAAPPAGTISGQLFSRIRPTPSGSHPQNSMVGRDVVWILKSEIEELKLGGFPGTFEARLLKYHFIDNVRGRTEPWDASHVRFHHSGLTRSMENAEDIIRIDGSFLMQAEAFIHKDVITGVESPVPESGYEGEYQARFRLADGELKDFAILVQGQAWGSRSYYSGVGRSSPDGKYPLIIAITGPNQDLLHKVPPGHVRWHLNDYLYATVGLMN